jgi:hypothetical protein
MILKKILLRYFSFLNIEELYLYLDTVIHIQLTCFFIIKYAINFYGTKHYLTEKYRHYHTSTPMIQSRIKHFKMPLF